MAFDVNAVLAKRRAMQAGQVEERKAVMGDTKAKAAFVRSAILDGLPGGIVQINLANGAELTGNVRQGVGPKGGVYLMLEFDDMTLTTVGGKPYRFGREDGTMPGGKAVSVCLNLPGTSKYGSQVLDALEAAPQATEGDAGEID